MSRRKSAEDLEFGADSFLDTVCNLVGVLTILVVIVGIRAGKVPPLAPAPVEAAPTRPTATRPAIDLATPAAAVQGLQRELIKLRGDLEKLVITGQGRDAERKQLALEVARREQLLTQQRGGLDAEAQRTFDLEREISAMEGQLDELDRELAYAQESPVKIEQVGHDTTPISSLVLSDEIHFRVQNNRVVAIPIERLLELVKQDMEKQTWKLRDGTEIESSVGPIDGFYVDYTVAMRQVMVSGARGGQLGTVVQVTSWTLRTENQELGEDLPTALSANSNFRRLLAAYPPRRTTVTFWVYPEGFGMFRDLKAELSRLGFPTAGRPLPEGVPISGSPHGSRSNAQ